MQRKIKIFELWLLGVRLIKTKREEKTERGQKKTIRCASTVTVKSSKG